MVEKSKLGATNLDSPQYYNNRELSWLAFNQRVLEEAMDDRNPLLERFKFLAIFSSNLDEFFMVRVAGLKDQVKVGFRKPENKAGLTPKEQLSLSSQRTHELTVLQYKTYKECLLPLLTKEGISIISMEEATNKQLAYLESYFDTQIYTVLTPAAIDAYRPFPKLLSKSLNLAIVIKDNRKDNIKIGQFTGKLAIVPIPAVLGRFVELPGQTDAKVFILLEEIITYFIHKLFKGFEIKSVTAFRITRNADLTIDEEGASDLLRVIEKEIKKHKWGSEVRLEVHGPSHDPNMLSYLQEKLDIHEKDTYIVGGPIDLTFLFAFYKELAGTNDHLTYDPFIQQSSKELSSDETIFEKVLMQDILLHHPYDSFDIVDEFISSAADDPSVLAIKQTLYRVSGNSLIIKSLKRAVENGKQVTVLVELKARFDEENNVHWAKELEQAGCQVIYGKTHLKTHSKITLIVRRRNGKNEMFVHLGTGNYNGITAKMYTDVSLITANRKIALDATNFFNYLSGYTKKPSYYYLSVAPYRIRKDFLSLIDREIECHRVNQNGHIIAKMNSLTDKILIKKLYEASNAGVKIELIIRGICCLRPGIEGVSENITVRSILGRFLEHSRIYFFHHNGERKTFLSSADMMTRNMENRIELLFPVLDDRLKERIYSWLTLWLTDNIKAREQDAEGNYHYVKCTEGEPFIDSQLELWEK